MSPAFRKSEWDKGLPSSADVTDHRNAQQQEHHALSSAQQHVQLGRLFHPGIRNQVDDAQTSQGGDPPRHRNVQLPLQYLFQKTSRDQD